MANSRRAATIYTSIAAIEADVGPAIAHYAIPLSNPALYRFVVASTTTVDNLNVLTHSGGTSGRWIREREDTKGSDLTDAAADITIAGDRYRVLPLATLTANRIITLKTTDAVAGDMITFTRLDVEAFTYTIANDGALGGNVAVLPSTEAWFVDAHYTGTNWELMRAGQLP